MTIILMICWMPLVLTPTTTIPRKMSRFHGSMMGRCCVCTHSLCPLVYLSVVPGQFVVHCSIITFPFPHNLHCIYVVFVCVVVTVFFLLTSALPRLLNRVLFWSLEWSSKNNLDFSLTPGLDPAREFGPESMTFWKIWVRHVLWSDLRPERRILWLKKSKKRTPLLGKVRVRCDLSVNIHTFLKDMFFSVWLVTSVEEDLAFGSYQPSLGPRLRGQQPSRPSLRCEKCTVHFCYLRTFLCYSRKQNEI